MMQPGRYRKIQSIFEQVCDLPEDQIKETLDQLCEQDPTLLKEVHALLEVDANMGDELDSINFESTQTDLQPIADFPEMIGAYKINGVLGQGGTSVVYDATQQNPSRSVALKVIHTRSMDADSVRRFEKEAQIMGRISHPCIAKVYESGIVKGRHGLDRFIAMELIDGTNLMSYARANIPKTNDKIKLFLDICDAMQYAHDLGVIHRDLKPGNILVDTNGRVKIIDFGIARFTSKNTDLTTMHTQVGQLIGTLAFMSPEQVKGHAHNIDERSDVYALGVILFQLLSNRLPYNLSQLSYFQAAKLIEDTSPLRLSTINMKMRGDLETIIAQSLEKDPTRRYSSVQALSDDLSRYLRNEPIKARPASTWYLARQFTRRHKGLSAGVGIAVIAIALGVIALSVGLNRAIESKNLAEQNAQVSRAITDFLLNDLIGQADARSSTDREMTIAEALDLSASKIDDRFQDQPLVEAEIRRLIGRTYTSLGTFELAKPQLQRSVDMYTSIRGKDDPETLNALEELGVLLSKAGLYSESEPVLTSLLEARTRVLGEEDNATLRTKNDLALLYTNMGKLQEAVELHTQALKIRLRTLGEDNFDTLMTQHNLALTLLYLGKPEQAAKMYEELIPKRVALLGENNLHTLLSMNNLAGAYQDMGELDKSLAIFKRIDGIQVRTLGATHPNTLRTQANIGSLLIRVNPEEAAGYLNMAYEGRLQSLGPEHPETMHSEFLLAYLAFTNGHLEQAREKLQSIYERQLTLLGPDHPDTTVTKDTLDKVIQLIGEQAKEHLSP